MSRIGKKPVPVPEGVAASVDGQMVKARGPRGELAFLVPDLVSVEFNDEQLVVAPRNESLPARAAWGMARTQLANLVRGVNSGFERRLEINGVGYRASVQGKNLQLALGFSHDVSFPIPEGIKIECPKPTEVVVSGADRQRVGEVAAQIRKFRPPEPYKGKGVKYSDERIIRKEGKKK
jgi:large subunit ribosomal protein L6